MAVDFSSGLLFVLGLHRVMIILCVAQGSECLRVAPCEAVALLAVWQCVEEVATVEEHLAEGALSPEEQHEEE